MPSRPRSAEVVLYLDLDGVVHHEAVMWHPRRGIYMHPTDAAGHSLFEWAPQLEHLLTLYPDVGLVLSSSWCVYPGYGDTLKRLPSDLRNRFVGGTYHKGVHGRDPWTLAQFREMPRGLQIWADVQRRKPRQWLALDDDVVGWPEWTSCHLVACEGSKGVSDPRVQRELLVKLALCRAAIVGPQQCVGADTPGGEVL